MNLVGAIERTKHIEHRLAELRDRLTGSATLLKDNDKPVTNVSIATLLDEYASNLNETIDMSMEMLDRIEDILF